MRILSVEAASPAESAGIRTGHRLLCVNGMPVADIVDYMFETGSEERPTFTLERCDGIRYSVPIERDGQHSWGLTLEEPRTRTCNNRCVFCFLLQNPSRPRLRKSLYLRDDDYRLSFLHGAYVTLTNLSEVDIKRIIAQRLSPLYVSVHSSDPSVRGRILGLAGPDDIIARMRRLADGGIAMHCQIVLCPGINDRAVLDQTIEVLAGMFPSVLSVAVVPVGLTDHRDSLPVLQPVGESEAIACLGQTRAWGERLEKEIGTRFVYAADEFFLLSGRHLPASSYYEDFPQVENGVGMIRRFQDRFHRRFTGLARRANVRGRPRLHITCVTGKLGESFMPRVVDKLNSCECLEVELLPVANSLFGDSVTVSGLLCGRDIAAALRSRPSPGVILLPPNCVNEDGVFLDDMPVGEIVEAVGRKVAVGSYDIVESIYELLENGEE